MVSTSTTYAREGRGSREQPRDLYATSAVTRCASMRQSANIVEGITFASIEPFGLHCYLISVKIASAVETALQYEDNRVEGGGGHSIAPKTTSASP